MTSRALIFATIMALVPVGASAQLLKLPERATLSGEQIGKLASYHLPAGPWADGNMPTVRAEGAVTQRAWKFPINGMTTLQILDPLRAQLREKGFEIPFQCDDDACGGFDFRYASDILPEPQMHVDLGDFQFLFARRTGVDADDEPEYVCLLVSRSSTSGYVHVVRVGAESDAMPTATVSTKTPAPQGARIGPGTLSDAGPLGQVLESRGRAVLGDLNFATGSSALGSGSFTSLSQLAAYLQDNPGRRITLVGHTDAEGTLEGNIALSRDRAQSVKDRLVNEFGVPAGQISARGVGFLVPIASNLTEQGRRENRRVEAVLTSTR